MGLPKKLLAPDERAVLTLRPHVKVLARPVLALLVTVPVAGLLIGLVPPSSAAVWIQLAVGLVAFVVACRWTFWPFLVWWNTLYAITDRRLLTRQGVFNRSGHDMPLTRLNDVSFSHTFVERILGCGTLVVESAGERGQLVLTDVPRVEAVQRTLYRLSDDARTGAATGPAEREDGDPYPDAFPDPYTAPTQRLDDVLPGDDR